VNVQRSIVNVRRRIVNPRRSIENVEYQLLSLSLVMEIGTNVSEIRTFFLRI
jgi:hypothetical protein